MQSTLKKQYLVMMIPAVGLFVVGGLARQFNLVRPGQFALADALPGVIFVFSALSALAGPLFLRTLFAHSTRGKTRVSAQKFLSFQQRILWVSLISPYLAFLAYFCDFPRFYAGASLLLAMYAVYYYFPSQKRIRFDQRIFRVQ